MGSSKSLRVLGMMSGTSLDGVDLALCRVAPDFVELEAYWRRRFPERLRARLNDAASGRATSWETGQLHHDVGRFYARAAKDALGDARIDGVGLHGQTVFHHPARSNPATLQIGEAAWVSEALRTPVVSNFRAADLAVGGQAAPLATLFHRVAFGSPGRFVCVNNLGGISNVTAIDWRRGEPPALLAFDTGPANMLLDMAARHLSAGRRACDRNGAWARRGRPCGALVEDWLAHPYFRRRPPKSTGRETFGEPFFEKVLTRAAEAGLSREDTLATLTEFTARSISGAYARWLDGAPDRVLICGGGARNPELVRRLRELLGAGPTEVTTSDESGWPPEAVEPAAFALLAAYRLWRIPANLPRTTGARRPVLLGHTTEL